MITLCYVAYHLNFTSIKSKFFVILSSGLIGDNTSADIITPKNTIFSLIYMIELGEYKQKLESLYLPAYNGCSQLRLTNRVRGRILCLSFIE